MWTDLSDPLKPDTAFVFQRDQLTINIWRNPETGYYWFSCSILALLHKCTNQTAPLLAKVAAVEICVGQAASIINILGEAKKRIV